MSNLEVVALPNLHLPNLSLPTAKWLYKRGKVWLDAKKFEGVYEAFNIEGRHYTPMPGAALTVISARPIWSPDPRVLDVTAYDFSHGEQRRHYGWIVLDSACRLRATRTVHYLDSDERSVQKLELSHDHRVIYVTPAEAGYSKHILRRVRSQLGLN